jgi:hypothetical protein
LKRFLIVLALAILAGAIAFWFWNNRNSQRSLSARIPPSQWVGKLNTINCFQWVKGLDLPQSDKVTWINQLPVNYFVDPILFGTEKSVFMATERSEERATDTTYQPDPKRDQLRVYEGGKYLLIGWSDSAEFQRVIQRFNSEDSGGHHTIANAKGLFSGIWQHGNKQIPIEITGTEEGIQFGQSTSPENLPALSICLNEEEWINRIRLGLNRVVKGHPYLEKSDWTQIQLEVNDTIHRSFTSITYRYDDFFNKVEERVTTTKVEPVLGFAGRTPDTLIREGKIRFEPNLAALELKYNKAKWHHVLNYLPVEREAIHLPHMVEALHIRLDSSGLNGFIKLSQELESDSIQ